MNEKQITSFILELQTRLLNRINYKIDFLYKDSPVEDFSEGDKAYEQALSECRGIIDDTIKELSQPAPNADAAEALLTKEVARLTKALVVCKEFIEECRPNEPWSSSFIESVVTDLNSAISDSKPRPTNTQGI